MILGLELLLAVLLLPVPLIAPKLGDRWFRGIESATSRLTARRRLAVLAVFLFALLLRLAVLSIEPVPVPGIHDEFGYLLAGETFAHGRLTNEPHRMWMHFESMTIIQQPTYCSAFWPAQGLFLAAGQVFLHHPFWGVWLSFGLMCAAFCWALQGWMPPGWALLGAILAAIRLGTFTYWANSYWGGAVAALGGALVFGALPRIKRRQEARDAVLMGIGFSLLANSRPYEGLVYSIPFLIALMLFVFGPKLPPVRVLIVRIALPLTTVMALTFALMAYYFWRTTGNPLRPPYLVDVATYFQEPQFIFQSLPPAKQYHHAVLQQFYGGYHVQMFLAAKYSLFTSVLGKSLYLWIFFVGPALTLPFCILAGILPYGISPHQLGHKTLFFLSIIGISFGGLLLLPYLNPHYAAPMACVTYALILRAMRRIRIWDRNERCRGIACVRTMVVVCVLVFAASAVGLAVKIPRQRLFPYDPSGPNIARANMIQQLNRQNGKHLIIVHYGREHNGHEEWVYNDADIDSSKVVWAREMGMSEDQHLIEYFKDRRVWFLDADQNPPQLTNYAESLHASASQVDLQPGDWRSK